MLNVVKFHKKNMPIFAFYTPLTFHLVFFLLINQYAIFYGDQSCQWWAKSESLYHVYRNVSNNQWCGKPEYLTNKWLLVIL